MRVAAAGGPLTSVTLVDVNADMLRVAEERAARRSFSSRLTFVEGNAEALPLPDSRFDAYTIAFGIRNVPRIEAALSEAYRVLKRGGRFLCLEFSRVDLPGIERVLRRLFVRRDPRPGQGRDRRRRPLPLSGGIHSHVSVSRFVRRDDRGERLPARRLHAPERRDRRHPLGLEALIVGILSSLGHSSRLARAAYVFSREGAFVGVDPALLRPVLRLALAFANLIAKRDGDGLAGLSRAIDRLGPSYVKLGQFLSTRPDIVGGKVAVELERLQDRVAPMSREMAVAIIEASFGMKIEFLFESFGEPVAAASIAQVHRAEVKTDDGMRPVAVKVLRAGIERRFARDLADMLFAARFAEGLTPEFRRLRLTQVVETLARSVRMEMDFRLEAAAASEFAENSSNDPEVRAPALDWNRTTREVMTMEWIDGVPLTDPQRLTDLGFDPPALARTLIQTFLRTALRDGFFHADMHQGNFFVDKEGRIVAVDFGIMGRLGRKERRFLAEILYGFIRRDYLRVAEVHFEAGYVPHTYRVEDFAQALRAIGEPIHSRTADQISMAKLLTLLFEITALFDMTTRVELVMLQKTMVVVEGVARKLDPQLNMWSTAEPVVSAWIAENLGPLGRLEDASRGLSSLAVFLANAPRHLDKIAARLETDATAAVIKAEHGLTRSVVYFLAFAILASALAFVWYHR